MDILFRTGLSGALSGFTTVLLFLSLFNYIIDAYLMYAASALAISTVVRSASRSGFLFFVTGIYERLNARIATTVLGAMAAASESPILSYLNGAGVSTNSDPDPIRAQEVRSPSATQVEVRTFVDFDIILRLV
ncbi:hypothetical protein RSOLAG1IB_07045 [Rhizoctonia solani AG-1 IB]|uniref:Uncharacterized protein n=1 Tax=Thanatephorus cucumeris (strain AG1-IB / isolate 7/3/14) TaxID=1108050 RepID=A0A0B7FDY3_THACB|nr:hypothetical protein RSOLAG1IB_07045 [Rhizoctonia solani AG-1 IB]